MTEASFSVTFKYGKGYDETWVVFKGNPAIVRDDIISYFGLSKSDYEGVQTDQLVRDATNIAHGKAAQLVATALGGEVVKEEAVDTPTAPSSESAPAAKAEESDSNKYILDQIEAQTSVDGLKRLYAENKDFFAEPSVLTAWKTKGKALKAA